MRNKNLAGSLLTLCMVGATVTPALAVQDNEASGESVITMIVEGESEDWGEYEDTNIMDITIPAVLPILADTDGKIVVPDNAKIVNNSDNHSVQIVELVVHSRGWELVDYDADLSKELDNTAKIGLRINGDKLDREGEISLTRERWKVGKELLLDIEAKIPKQTEASKRAAVNIQYMIDWDNGEVEDIDSDIGVIDLEVEGSDEVIKTEDDTGISNEDSGIVVGDTEVTDDEVTDGEVEVEDEIEADDDREPTGGVGEIENSSPIEGNEEDISDGIGTEYQEDTVEYDIKDENGDTIKIGEISEIEITGNISSIDILDDNIIEYMDRVDMGNKIIIKLLGKGVGSGKLKIVFDSGEERVVKVDVVE